MPADPSKLVERGGPFLPLLDGCTASTVNAARGGERRISPLGRLFQSPLLLSFLTLGGVPSPSVLSQLPPYVSPSPSVTWSFLSLWSPGEMEEAEVLVALCSGPLQRFPFYFCTRTPLSSNCVLTRIWNVHNAVCCLIEIGVSLYIGNSFPNTG